jgi:taurine transport system permease protein
MAPRIKNFFLGSSLFLGIAVLWYLLSALNVIPSWYLPGPFATLATFWKLIRNGSMEELILGSLINVIPAFFLAVVISLALGIIIGMNETFRKIFSPFISAIYLIPSLAWLPLIILFLGFTRSSIWAVVFISSFVRIIYSVIGGVRGLNQNWLLVAKNMELGRFRTVFKIVLPGALPQILSGIRIGFGSAWRSLIGAEMLVVTAGGLGKYIWMSQWAFKFDQVFSGLIVIALIGILAEQYIFRRIEQRTMLKWGMMQ